MFAMTASRDSTPTAAGGHSGAQPTVVDYAGPERRTRGTPRITPWFAATLDELDFGVVLLSDVNRVVHANHAARSELDATHPLQTVGQELRVRRAADVVPFADALHAAAHRGLRRLLTLGEGEQRISASVVPLAMAAATGPATTLVMLGKRRVCDSLAVQGYSRSHRLTGAESRVLWALCRGLAPSEIAAELGVGIATVRTQIGSIRQKTGADSIRALVQEVATLPPLVGVLRGSASGSIGEPQSDRLMVA